MEFFSYKSQSECLKNISLLLGSKRVANGDITQIKTNLELGNTTELVSMKLAWQKINVFRDIVSREYILGITSDVPVEVSGKQVSVTDICMRPATSLSKRKIGETISHETKQMRKHSFMLFEAIDAIAYATKKPKWQVRSALLASIGPCGTMTVCVSNKFSITVTVDIKSVTFLTSRTELPKGFPVKLSCTKNNNHKVYRRLRRMLQVNAQRRRYRAKKTERHYKEQLSSAA